jgi:hypothetical protein
MRAKIRGIYGVAGCQAIRASSGIGNLVIGRGTRFHNATIGAQELSA